jgi:hypothetical protein
MAQTSLNSTGVASSGSLVLQTNGTTSAVTIDTSQNVGIGTSSPAGRVHSWSASSGATPSANGNQLVAENSGNAGITIASGASSLGNIFFADSGDAADGFVQYDQSGRSLRFGTATAEKMRLDASGNLGIGTSSPSRKLSVVGSGVFTDGTNDITLYNDGSVGTNGSVNLKLVTAGTTKATLDTSGNLGLGVTPNAWATNRKTLQINRASLVGTDGNETNLGSNYYWNGTSNLYIASTNATLYNQGAGAHSWLTSASGTAGNAITFTQAMTLDASGNLLVGTTSSGGNNTTGAALIYNSGSSYASWGHITGTGSGTGFHQFLYAGGVIGSITQSGTTAVLYNVTSDQRLKENIVDANSASTLIDALQVRQFDWKADGNHQRYGFIAQELVTVAPEAVHQPADADDMMAVDYSKLVPMLVKEIQSLRQRVAQLESN